MRTVDSSDDSHTQYSSVQYNQYVLLSPLLMGRVLVTPSNKVMTGFTVGKVRSTLVSFTSFAKPLSCGECGLFHPILSAYPSRNSIPSYPSVQTVCARTEAPSSGNVLWDFHPISSAHSSWHTPYHPMLPRVQTLCTVTNPKPCIRNPEPSTLHPMLAQSQGPGGHSRGWRAP